MRPNWVPTRKDHGPLTNCYSQGGLFHLQSLYLNLKGVSMILQKKANDQPRSHFHSSAAAAPELPSNEVMSMVLMTLVSVVMCHICRQRL